jgi:hypothetical protein
MYCTKCGTQLPDAAAFCSKCGAPTSLVEARHPTGDFSPDGEWEAAEVEVRLGKVLEGRSFVRSMVGGRAIREMQLGLRHMSLHA